MFTNHNIIGNLNTVNILNYVTIPTRNQDFLSSRYSTGRRKGKDKESLDHKKPASTGYFCLNPKEQSQDKENP